MTIPVIPLTTAYPDTKVKVVSLTGGRGFQQHLIDMGMSVGSVIEVIKPGSPGPFLIAAGETRLAVGAGMAKRIMVSLVEEGEKKNDFE